MSVTIKFVSILFLGLLFPLSIHATGIAPSATDISFEAGGAGDVIVSVINDTEQSASYKIYFNSVEIGDKLEDLKFADVNTNSQVSISSLENEFTLDQNEIKELVINLETSSNSESGVYVFAVLVEGDSKDSSGIMVNTTLVSLIFVTIGDVGQSVEWLSFSGLKGLYFSFPVSTYLTVRNNDERIVQPEGTIVISSWLGNEVDIISVNESSLRVPENHTRTFETVWGDQDWRFAIGYYSAVIEVEPWDGGDLYRKEITFFILPIREIGIAIAVLSVAWLLVRRRKK